MTQWRKSSRSNTSGGACVEVARLAGAIGIRDSKAPAAGHLTLSPENFAALLTQAKRDNLTP